MLRTLLESNAAPTRRRGGMLASIGLHTAVIALAVAATARANLGPAESRIDPFYRSLPYIEMPVPRRDNAHRPPVPAERPICCIAAAPTIDVPPVTIADKLPPIEAKLPPIQEDWPGASLAIRCYDCENGGTPHDSATRGMASPTNLYTPATVDWAARPKPNNPYPVYPAALRSAQLEGAVVAQFIVDTIGRAEPASIIIRQATHPLFGDAVRQALLHSRYEPAMVGNHRVRQLVEQRFTFTLLR